MANIKISSLEETKISNPDASFVMVVAKDDASNLYKNYRISLSELRNIIGSIEGDIVTGVTEEQVRSIVNGAISADNLDELTSGTVEEMIERAIANIPVVEPGLSESEIQSMINTSIAADNRNELTISQVSTLIDNKIAAIPEVTPGLSESEIQDMIDASITVDNLKNTVAEVVPDVIPEVIPNTEIQVEADDEPIVLTVKEVAEKVVVQENTVVEVQEHVTEITKEIKEDCVCAEHADNCFNTVFNV